MPAFDNEIAELFRHGGNLDAARRAFPTVDRWLDLSTGISPHAYPVPAIPLEDWQRLPDADAVRALRQAASDFFGLASPDFLAEAPGTQAILQLLPRVFASRQVCVLSPTYSEHARCWTACGAAVSEIPALEDIPDAVQAVVVVNPNNPDGRVFERESLLATADRLAKREGVLIVDEAFCDGRPDFSLATEAGRPGLLVLRSFGKFFGLAGLRLGFALGPRDLMARLRREIGPWAVSGPALRLAGLAYADHDWISEAGKRHQQAVGRLQSLCGGFGLKTIGKTQLFVLLQTSAAPELWAHLAGHGIWTRLFDYNPSWMRLGLPGSDDQWDHLESVLDGWKAAR